MNQGKGIYLVKDITDIQRKYQLLEESNTTPGIRKGSQSRLIQRYPWGFNLFASEAVWTRNFIFNRRSVDVLTRIPFFESFAGSRVNTPHVAVAFVGWRVYTDKRHCRQWMSSLFCRFLPNLLSTTCSVCFVLTDTFQIHFFSMVKSLTSVPTC